MMPGDDAGKGYSIEIADRSADSSRGVDDIAILEASVICRQRVFDVESHPVSLGWPAVDKKHDAESDSVHNGEGYREPNTPVPLLGVCASDEAAVEEQDRHLGTPAADQEGELREPHAQHSI